MSLFWVQANFLNLICYILSAQTYNQRHQSLFNSPATLVLPLKQHRKYMWHDSIQQPVLQLSPNTRECNYQWRIQVGCLRVSRKKEINSEFKLQDVARCRHCSLTEQTRSFGPRTNSQMEGKCWVGSYASPLTSSEVWTNRSNLEQSEKWIKVNAGAHDCGSCWREFIFFSADKCFLSVSRLSSI